MDASPLFHASNYRENANAPAAYNPVGKTAAGGGRYSFTKTPSGSRRSKADCCGNIRVRAVDPSRRVSWLW
jgi:hypothetical protein